MNNLEQILEMWKKDSVIDDMNLDESDYDFDFETIVLEEAILFLKEFL